LLEMVSSYIGSLIVNSFNGSLQVSDFGCA